MSERWVVGGPLRRISIEEFALILLLDALGPVSVSEIIRHLGTAQATTTEICERAEENGLVTRVRRGRETFVDLTSLAASLRRRTRSAQ